MCVCVCVCVCLRVNEEMEMEIVVSDDDADNVNNNVGQDRWRLFRTVSCNFACITADELCSNMAWAYVF